MNKSWKTFFREEKTVEEIKRKTSNSPGHHPSESSTSHGEKNTDNWKNEENHFEPLKTTRQKFETKKKKEERKKKRKENCKF